MAKKTSNSSEQLIRTFLIGILGFYFDEDSIHGLQASVSLFSTEAVIITQGLLAVYI